MNKESVFLVMASLGLVPIALVYGALPQFTVPVFYGVEVDTVNGAHIFRAVMGLYLGMVLFWLLGAANAALRVPALYSLVVFMLGLAAGRALSIVLDGMPSPAFVVYLGLEIFFGLLGLALARDLAARS